MTIDTKLQLGDYLLIVDAIASNYFSDSGDYQPQVGILNAMRLFYNYCVTSSEHDEDIPHDFADASKLAPLVEDSEFMAEFNKAIAAPEQVAFDFANAYKDAIDIVTTKKTSLDYTLDKLQIICNELITQVGSLVSEIDVEQLNSLAEKIQSGDLNANAIVDAYGKSQRFKDVAAGVQDTYDNNVVPLTKE